MNTTPEARVKQAITDFREMASTHRDDLARLKVPKEASKKFQREIPKISSLLQHPLVIDSSALPSISPFKQELLLRMERLACEIAGILPDRKEHEEFVLNLRNVADELYTAEDDKTVIKLFNQAYDKSAWVDFSFDIHSFPTWEGRQLGEQQVPTAAERLAPLRITIRKMLPKDHDCIVKMIKESFEFPWSDREVDLFPNLKNNFRMVAEAEGELVGFLFYRIENNQADLFNFGVSRHHRFREVGKRMDNILASRLRANGGPQQTVILIGERNEGALKFFSKQGYKGQKVLRNYYKDRHEDAIRLVKRLNPIGLPAPK